MKTLLSVVGIGLLILGILLISLSYREYSDPKQIYGNWVELNVMAQVQDIYTFNKQGVYRNSHLITTTFEYDGAHISFHMGDDTVVYLIAGTNDVPQLKRIEPERPPQILIRQDDEEILDEKKPHKMVIRPNLN